MRLIRFGDSGGERPGILTKSGQRKDLSAHFSGWDRHFFQTDGLQRLSAILAASPVDELKDVPDTVRWGSPVARPGKIICIGLNYSDHARESGMPIPAEPIVFLKGSNTVVGPYDNILIPRTSTKTDWEVELGVVIGADARYLASPAESAKYIAGYCISHDVSERHFQLERGGQWTKGKSCDTFNPLGPWLSTCDQTKDTSTLTMSLSVNGIVRQRGNTSTMIFNVDTLVYYLSQFMTLEAGDLISTGTPPGVGLGMKPPQYLRHGDVVEIEIESLGKQRQTCVNA
jgi:2-keto-4-pentenoate hydratase/2-oxohepta-3-ene-1,7-dioic acid hydratase in catechol pathway